MTSPKKQGRSLWLFILSTCLVPFLFSFQNPTQSDYLFLVFEGSDWCTNCRQLEKDVLSQEAFTQFLTEKGIQLQKIDFPQRKKQSKEEKEANAELAERYQFNGTFPTMILSRTDAPRYQRIDYDRQTRKKLQSEILLHMASLEKKQ